MLIVKSKSIKKIITGIFCVVITFPVFGSVCFTAQNFIIYEYSAIHIDFNNDGINDKYEIVNDSSRISLSANGLEFENSYQIIEEWALNDQMSTSQYGIPTEVISVDVNNDGYQDVIASFGSRIIIRLNKNSGDFSQEFSYISLSDLYGVDETPVSELLAQYQSNLASLDINHDGYKDLVVIHAEGISIFMNDTLGGFNYLNRYLVPSLYTKVIDSVFVSDLDSDSNPEVIVSSFGSYVLYFDSLSNLKIVEIKNNSGAIEAVNYDSDGDLDFIEVDVSQSTCSFSIVENVNNVYWVNNGNGVFESIDEPVGGGIDISGGTFNFKEPGSGSLNYFVYLFIFSIIAIIRTGRVTRIESMKIKGPVINENN